VEQSTEPRSRLPIAGIPLALVVIAGYLAVIILSSTVARRAASETGEELVFIATLLILAPLVLVIAYLSGLRPWRSRSLGRIAVVGFVPPAFLMASTLFVILTGSVTASALAIAFAIAVLVGIAEETLFRGITLNALGGRLTVPWAVIASSLLFAVAHLTNAFSQGGATTLAQAGFTLLAAFVWGWIYVATRGNLLLVIVMHAAWDFSLFVALEGYSGEGTHAIIGGLLIAPGIVTMAILAIILTIRGVRRYRGARLEDVLA
jgi:membrane protease YdiL (CAAX protease family)